MRNPVEQIQRDTVVTVARSWLGTPYHHMGRIKGREGGVDCLTLLAEVYSEAGLIPRPDVPHYPRDFMNHRSAELYLDGVLKYCGEVTEPLPGDIAVWKFGRCFSHGAIVIDWPRIIHAHSTTNCLLDDAERAQWLKFIGENTADRGKLRPVKFFSYWNK